MMFKPITSNTEPDFIGGLYHNTQLNSIGFDSIETGNNYHFFGDGKISLHHVIAKALSITGPSDIYVLTWSLSTPAMKALVNLRAAGLIINAFAAVDKRAPKDHADAYSMAVNYFNRLTITANHSKIVVLDNPRMPVAITGSANLTNNPKQEYFMVSADKCLTGFFMTTIEQMIEKGEKVK